MSILISYTTFVWIISRSKKNRARCDKKCTLVYMYSTSHSCQILRKFKFFLTFSKNTQITNFIKTLPEGAELFHEDGGTDRWTDIMKLIVTFAILWMCLKSSSDIVPYMVHSFIILKFVNNLRFWYLGSPSGNYNNTVI
jgi:hypothetical protein